MVCVLVVDDDPHIREAVCFALQQEGYGTVIAADGREALAQHRKFKPDLVILDILMPELDGLAVCREIRQISAVPILLLSSRDEEVDRILGLDMGADDYIGKPFSPRELVARVRANLRREAAPAQNPSDLIEVDGYVVDGSSFTATWQGKPLELTQTEFHLLRTLASHPDKVFNRDDLMNGAYIVSRVVSHRTIDSHMRRLREKLRTSGAPGVRTVHGIGYRLNRP